MIIEIIEKDLSLNIYGFSGVAANKNYAERAFQLSSKMWDVVKAKNIKNRGKNIWVYEDNERVFAGIELENAADASGHGLEEKNITLRKYACFKHIGPYNLIKQVGQKMINELTKQGLEVTLPYIEIYGHWTGDETKSETELLMCLK